MLFGIGGILVTLALGVVFFADDETALITPQTQVVDLGIEGKTNSWKTTNEGITKQSLDQDESDGPSFIVQKNIEPQLRIEIARVKPDGAAVLAGSAPKGATISVFEDKMLLFYQ